MNPFRILESTGEYLPSRPVTSSEIVDQAKQILLDKLKRPGETVFTCPDTVREFLRLTLAPEKREVFGCLFLDNRHRLITYESMFFGTIDGASIHPRVVAQRALEVNAAALLIAHNHPSQHPEPSQADVAITRRLKDSLGLLDIRLLDHLIVALDEVTSLAERGLV